MKSRNNGIRISFAAQMKPVPVAGFIIQNKNSVETVSKQFRYRSLRLVKSEHGWYIGYSYRIPQDVRKLYNDKEWMHFRIKMGINHRKGSDRLEYAEWLLSEIKKSLKEGYNPFNAEKEFIAEEREGIETPEELNATAAMELFLDKWKDKGLEPTSYSKYERYVTRFMSWLKLKSIPYTDVNNITQDHIENFLAHVRTTYSLSNREVNNHYDFIRTAFNFLLRKKLIESSPCAGYTKLKTKVTKHRFYDAKSLEIITRALAELDTYTLLAFQTVYHLCVRSDKELMNLKVGNIQWESNSILAEVSKTDQRYIPMDENIKTFFREHIKDAPGNFYIFGIEGKPSIKPFGTGFFAKRFRKVRDMAGLSSDYTLYGAKHTRVVHLKQDGATDADIMSLTGHKDFNSYAKYLRDLGMDADAKKLSLLSRKI